MRINQIERVGDGQAWQLNYHAEAFNRDNHMLRRALLTAWFTFSLLASSPGWACLNKMEGERDYDRAPSGSVRHEEIRNPNTGEKEYYLRQQTAINALLPIDPWRDGYAGNIRDITTTEERNPGETADQYRERVKEQRPRNYPRVSSDHSNLQSLNDEAVYLIVEGRSEESIEILEGAEKKHPGHYEIASNLGTAYELAGDNQAALKWIQEGIKRNPESHDQSEWLHVLILRAKIAQETNPDYLKTHGIMGLDFRSGPLPQPVPNHLLPKGNTGEPLSYAEILQGLEYQLRERMTLVPPTDAVVADLLYDYAQLSFLTKGAGWANHVMQGAEAYGVQRHGFQKRKNAMKQWEADNPNVADHHPTLWAVVAGLLLLTWPWHRSSKTLAAKAQKAQVIEPKETRKWAAWSLLEGLAVSALPTFLWLSSGLLWTSTLDKTILGVGVLIGVAAHYRSLTATGSTPIRMISGMLIWLIWCFLAISSGDPGPILVYILSTAMFMWGCRLLRGSRIRQESTVRMSMAEHEKQEMEVRP